MAVNNTSGVILIVDDEPAIRRFLRTTLAAHDYRVLEVETGEGCLRLLHRDRPDLVILDLGLPDMDGVDVIRAIRKDQDVPIVVLSSRDDEQGKVDALDGGADDYVTKPFGIEELLARLRTALRHRIQVQGGRPVHCHGLLKVDLIRRLVQIGSIDVKLSPKEYDLLAELVTHAGKVLTHRHLLSKVWPDSSEADVQYLRVYVRQLRHKIEDDPSQPVHIITEPGVGYRLMTDA